MKNLDGFGLLCLLVGVFGFSISTGRQVSAQSKVEKGNPSSSPNPNRVAYFGDLHIHTSWSIDSYVFGTRAAGPQEAIMFAQGESVRHPGGFIVQLKRPLDFMLLMDHGEYTGALSLANDSSSSFSKTPRGQELQAGTKSNAMQLYADLSSGLVKGQPDPVLQGMDVAGYSWKRICELAEAASTPGEFTAFPGWEWTSTPNNRNLHRNVLFKDPKSVSPAEFSSIESMEPNELWKWMDAQRATGNDVMAITHNGNLSDGALYPRGRSHADEQIDKDYSETRMRNEPLAEIAQVKGQSETTPLLSPEDEFADFNVFDWLLLGAKGTTTDYGSYMRLALRDGIAMQSAHGYNPYKFGFNGASDAHSAMSSYRADDYFGQHSTFDDTPEERLSAKRTLNMDNRKVCLAGLTGVWAEENTRESLWASMQRKETYATSGPRLKVRLFGGWDFSDETLKGEQWIKNAYAGGVPMGGDLANANSKSASFIVWAEKDPDGANLDRVQIIKGWAKHGQSFEKIYDVVWSGDRKIDVSSGKLPAVGNTVDISKGTFTDTIGSAELRAVWVDPDFDPSVDAFYYARVLQIPTPRWTTVESARQGVVPPDVVPLTIQDRCWSSPIWYTPDDEARKLNSTGLTVKSVQEQGGEILDDEQIKTLVVGKTLSVLNTVSGHRVELLFGEDGRRLVLSMDGRASDATALGDPLHDSATYSIREGNLVTVFNGTLFRVQIYKHDGKYVAARSDEFGFVNYKISTQ